MQNFIKLIRVGSTQPVEGLSPQTRGKHEAVAYAQGKKIAVKTYRPKQVDVVALRQHMGMTQEQFAARFGFSVATLRHWERGDRNPQGAALVLLNGIKHAPDAVKAALN